MIVILNTSTPAGSDTFGNTLNENENTALILLLCEHVTFLTNF